VACVYKVASIVIRLGLGDNLNYKLGDILDEEEVKTLREGSQFTVTIT
jgi:hypothetical protein